MSKNLILVLEDDEIECMKLARAIKKLGFANEVCLCKNGLEGINWLKTQKERWPKFILLDLNMPVMNGIEFLESVKKDPVWKAIPVVVLTTSNAVTDRATCYKSSIAGYFTKPLRHEHYEDTVKDILKYWNTSEPAN